jgi:hypothetical protein
LSEGRDGLDQNSGISPGCGPMQRDTKYGSKSYDKMPWWSKLLERNAIQAYKHFYFHNMSWESIDFDDFFFVNRVDPMSDRPIILSTADEDCKWSNNTRPMLTHASEAQYLANILEPEMGHPVCNVSDTAHPEFDSNNFFYYTGKCSWISTDWESMLASMQKLMKDNPFVRVWNEIVMERPLNLPDTVQAIFFMEGGINDDDDKENYDEALQQATKMQKDLLKIETSGLFGSGPLFTCNVSVSERFQQE